jgi:hypothetical protein
MRPIAGDNKLTEVQHIPTGLVESLDDLPTIDPATIEEFNVRICDLIRLYEPCLVSNMDETSWKLINMNIKTIAERGADE